MVKEGNRIKHIKLHLQSMLKMDKKQEFYCPVTTGSLQAMILALIYGGILPFQ